jgi:serpin B
MIRIADRGWTGRIPVCAMMGILTLFPNVGTNSQAFAMEGVTEGNIAFAARLVQQLGDQADGNLFLSPVSISTAMAMTLAGARGETRDEMMKVMGWSNLDPEQVQNGFGELNLRMDAIQEQEGVELVFANALWPEKTHAFLESYLELVTRTYQAGVKPLDFVGASEEARQTINDWVEKKTRGRIKDLLPAGSLNALTRLVLTNAVFFHGAWAEKFPEEATVTGVFFVSPDKPIQGPMMHGSVNVGQMPGEGVTFIELPYKGDSVSMVILLPDKDVSLADMEKDLESHLSRAVSMRFPRRENQVVMPRFSMTSNFSLANTLVAMGMKKAFSMDADLSGMDGSNWLYISGVFHKAFVDVSEEGTEAAAATGVVISLKSAPMPSRPVVIDRPFWFMIRDVDSGSALFLGRVVNPFEKSDG